MGKRSVSTVVLKSAHTTVFQLPINLDVNKSDNMPFAVGADRRTPDLDEHSQDTTMKPEPDDMNRDSITDAYEVFRSSGYGRRKCIDHGEHMRIENHSVVSVLDQPLPGDKKFLLTHGRTAVLVGSWCGRRGDLLRTQRYLERKWKNVSQKKRANRESRQAKAHRIGNSFDNDSLQTVNDTGDISSSYSNGASSQSASGRFSDGSRIPTVQELEEWLKEQDRKPAGGSEVVRPTSSQEGRESWATKRDTTTIGSNHSEQTSHLQLGN